MIRECEVACSNFLGSQDNYYYLKQKGMIDTDSWYFTPNKGGYPVCFHDEISFLYAENEAKLFEGQQSDVFTDGRKFLNR
jgi:hypothetical protein